MRASVNVEADDYAAIIVSLLRALAASVGEHEYTVSASLSSSSARGELGGVSSVFSQRAGVRILHCDVATVLCRWIADRVALPADTALSLFVSSVRKGGDSGDARYGAWEDDDGASQDDLIHAEEGELEHRGTAAVSGDHRLSSILPVHSPPLMFRRPSAWRAEGGDAAADVSGVANGPPHHHLGRLPPVLSLRSSSSPSSSSEHEIDGDGGADIDSLLRRLQETVHMMRKSAEWSCGDVLRNAERLQTCWKRVKERQATFPRLVNLSLEQAREVLDLYAGVSVELVSFSFLRALWRSVDSSPAAAAAEDVSSAIFEAVNALLRALQVSRAAVKYFASVHCERLIHERIRPLLGILLSPWRADSSRVQLQLHRHVELSIDPYHSVAGCGLVAVGPIGEGELVVQEEALCMVGLPFHTGETSADGAGSPGGQCPSPEGLLREALYTAMGNTGTASAQPSSDADSRLHEAHDDGDEISLVLLKYLTHARRVIPDAWHHIASAVATPAPTSPSSQNHGHGSTVIAPAHESEPAEGNPASSHAETSTQVLQWHGSATAVTASSPLSAQLFSLNVRSMEEFRIELSSPSRLQKPSETPVFDGNATVPDTSRGAADTPGGAPKGESATPPRAYFAFLRFVNHSCTPNCALVFESADASGKGSGNVRVVASLVALTSIEDGVELTVSYLPATTMLTVSLAEQLQLLGFRCECSLCTQKAALLRGVICGTCGQLVYDPMVPAAATAGCTGPHERGVQRRRDGFASTLFRHSEDCVHRGRAGMPSCDTVEPVCPAAVLLQERLDAWDAWLDGDGGQASEGGCVPLAAAVRRLVDLDASVAPSIPPTHCLRTRLRLEVFAYAAVARGLGSTVSAEVIYLCANTLEKLEMLMPSNHPLLTGLRMFLVFSRGRHLRAVQEVEAIEQGTRHVECCGAVREQAALMQLPFVVDTLIRRCVARCFQEHYVQFLSWREAWLQKACEADVLRTFLRRYPVELEACGVTTVEHMELLSCVEDDTADA